MTPSGLRRVAILDTGIDGSHPDLDGNVVAGTSILDGSNGLSDPNGHGTAMAGIVAAETDNGAGVAGVGYAGVQVMPVIVLGADGTGQDRTSSRASSTQPRTARTSSSCRSRTRATRSSLQEAIDYAWDEGVVLVAATGNDGSSAATFPAGDRGVIGVSDTDQSDALTRLEQLRAGRLPRRTRRRAIATTSAGGGYGSITGTSASAAHVAGAAALVRGGVGRLERRHRVAPREERGGGRHAAQTGNGRLNLDRASPNVDGRRSSRQAPLPSAPAAPSSGRMWLPRATGT